MSFWELLVVLVVGLLVVGPERLPEAIRSAILWFGRFKRAIHDTRAEFEQQLGVDDIRRELHNEKVLQSLKAMEKAHKKAASEAERLEDCVKQEAKKIEHQITPPVKTDTPSQPDSKKPHE